MQSFPYHTSAILRLDFGETHNEPITDWSSNVRIHLLDPVIVDDFRREVRVYDREP